MTNDEFASFILRHWPSGDKPNYSAAGAALGMDREVVKSLCTGRTRAGNPVTVPTYMVLAARAFEPQIDGDAGRVRQALALLEAAEGILKR